MSGKKTLRVLVADDNATNQAVLKGMLEYAGHQVDTAFNGKTAIQALEKFSYDLVIMDCLMPVMDGFAATRSIRAATSSVSNPNIPILAITALATPKDQQKCLDAGMSGYINKPVVARDLFAWIAARFDTGPVLAGNKANHARGAKQTASAADLIRKMSPMLVRDATQWQQELRTLCDNHQLGKLGALAHKIRGTADILGFKKLSAIAAELEKSGKTADAINASAQVGQLIKALQILIRKVQKTDPARNLQ